MKLLFLTSVGLPPETREYFLKELPKKPEEMKVAFIPTAADPEENKGFVRAAYDELVELKFPVIQVDLKESKEKVRTKLEKADIIYINGGNTFYLLDWARKSGLDTYLPKLINNGKVYLGVSAGSILAGPDIAISGWDPSWDKNDYVSDTTGLNLVQFAVSPHYTEKERQVLEKEGRKVTFPVIAISDEQAILVKDGSWKVVGKGKPEFYGAKFSNDDDFYRLLESLTDNEWNTRVDDMWTVKNVVAHLVGWEEELSKLLPQIWKNQEKPWFTETNNWDELNEKSTDKFKGFTPRQLLDEWYKWQGKLMKEAEKIGENNMRSRPDLFGWWFEEGEESHYQTHYKQIRKALNK